ncbi:MAG: (Fe-S)-binding protein [Microscillaceae bacterium]|nr:(Fe-S)-binding protein [Microscillaceae bacterium]
MRLLQLGGHSVEVLSPAICCGEADYRAGDLTQWHLHQSFLGRLEWDKLDYLVVASGRCSSVFRLPTPPPKVSLAQWQQVATKTLELSEFLQEFRPDFAQARPHLSGRAYFLDACHYRQSCGSKLIPLQLLQEVAGLTLVEDEEMSQCCGFGGYAALQYPAWAQTLAEQKAEIALRLQADYVISTEVACLWHLRQYFAQYQKPIQTLHLADALLADK